MYNYQPQSIKYESDMMNTKGWNWPNVHQGSNNQLVTEE